MSGEYPPDVLAELHTRLADNLARWSLSPDASISLLNVSENATFAVREAGRALVLRVHRVGYSDAAEIRSELAWMNALREDAVIETSAAFAGVNGECVQELQSRTGMPPRFVVAFEFLPGQAPDSKDAVGWFERLGELTARMHRHSQSWALPPAFRRKCWDFEAMVGPHGFWGSWRNGVGLSQADVGILEKVLEMIQRRLQSLGRAANVFGLVHADLRLANLLVDGPTLRIIDFDDCGFSWYLYDFATAVSFIEHEPMLPALLGAWLRGYRRQTPLDVDLAAEIPVFVVLRRILLTAWLASHAEVPLARSIGTSFTAGTVALADQLLRGVFLASVLK